MPLNSKKETQIHPTEYTTACLKTAEDNLQKSIKQANTNFESHLINNFAFNNDSKIYQYVRSFSKLVSIPPIVFFQDNIGM